MIRAIAIPSLAFLAWRIWWLAFLTDDAFISFRYARNLLEGHGLVFNPGERVEGYTNFLWVLEVAALWLVGIEPPTGATILSVACTAGVLAVVRWWGAQSPELPEVGWLAVLLLALDRNFAVWATSGLETRQFTLLVTAGLALLPVRGVRPQALASLCFALAALTRPEGLLFFGVAAVVVLSDGRDRRELAALVGPFVAIVGAHLLFRVGYYGDVVPNTYYAKHVRPWPRMGLRYLLVAAIEGGWILGLPLAVVGWVARAASTGRPVHLAGPLAVLAHAVFVVRVGGDHFEFRPLDAWWPVLFLGVAEGLAVVATAVGRAPAVGLGAVVVVWGSVFEVAHDRAVAEADRPDRHVRLPFPMPLYDRTFGVLLEHNVAVRHWRHREFCDNQLQRYGRLLEYREELALPDDAVDAIAVVGVMPYHLPDLVVIDTLGLTDPVVARNPVVVPNWQRRMAHDRRPPEGYLEERGVNLDIGEPTATAEEALAGHGFAVRLAEDLFLPLDSPDPEWVRETFGERLVSL